MEAKELRIGNYIWHIGLGDACIEEIRKDGITICNPKNTTEFKFEPIQKIYRLEPIPLTEGWLVKFGFVNIRDYPVFSLNDIRIEFNGFDSVWKVDLYTGKTIIKYVHQLQSLYFALTGEELTAV